MTFWPLTNNDFATDQTSHQFHDLYTELDLHRIMSGFHGAFATGVAGQQGTLTLPDTWFRPPIWSLLMLQLLRPNSSNLPCLYSTFHLEYPLVLSRFCSNNNLILGSNVTYEELHITFNFNYLVSVTAGGPVSPREHIKPSSTVYFSWSVDLAVLEHQNFPC